MTITTPLTTDVASASALSTKRGFGDISARWTGVGALAFTAIVLAQNVVRGATAPANDASNADVLTKYADHRAVTAVLIGMFVVSGFSLAIFLGGAMRRLLDSERRGWALTGFVGAIGILAVFTVLVGTDQALSVAASRSQPDASAVGALWALHNSIFTVLLLMISVALIGLSRAGVAAGITPRAFERIAPVGSALLFIGAVGGPAVAAGDMMALFAAGGIGFLIWLAFLATTGTRLVRSAGAR
jgi:hypothetical protein